MSELSQIQIQTLNDIADDVAFKGRTRTLSALKRKGYVDYETTDEPWLTQKGKTWCDSAEYEDSDSEDVVEAAYFLGKQVARNPGLGAIAAVGFLLGNLVKRK